MQRYESQLGCTLVPSGQISEVALEGHRQYLRIRRYDIPRIHSIRILIFLSIQTLKATALLRE